MENTIDCHVEFFGIFISSATITVEPFVWIFSYNMSVPAETYNAVVPLYKCGSGKVDNYTEKSLSNLEVTARFLILFLRRKRFNLM